MLACPMENEPMQMDAGIKVEETFGNYDMGFCYYSSDSFRVRGKETETYTNTGLKKTACL